MANQTFFSGACDLLGSKTDWAAADLASSANRYLGPKSDGTFTIDTTETNVGLFDTRAYRQLLLIWTGTFANAVTLEVDIRHYTDPTTAVFVSATYATSAASGGVVVLMTGAPISGASVGADAAYNALHSVTPLVAPAVRLKLFNSGATGAITSGTLFLYGIR